MKINSKYLFIVSALLAFAIVISSVGAVDDLVSNEFENESFVIDIPSGSDFSKEVTTVLKVDDVAMNMSVFENHGDNSDDVSTIMYLKDSSSNKDVVNDFINDFKKDGDVIEENSKFIVIKTQNSNNWDFLNIGDDINSFWSFIDGIFSSDSEADVSTNDADVKVSSADGINIDSENSSVKLSSEGLHVSDANGSDVSISTDGVKVSNGASDDSGNDSANTTVSVNANAIPNVDNGDYAICIKNLEDGQVIIITGNNLDLMESMAQSASFAGF